MRGSVGIAAVALLIGSAPAGAVPFSVMFESINDDGAGDELAFVSFPSFDPMIDNVGGTSIFSEINVNPFFNTTGLMAVVDFGGGGEPPPPPVPLPPALALMMAGLAGLAGAGSLRGQRVRVR